VEPEETVVAGQRLGKHVSAAANTHTAIEELLDMGFFCVVHVISNTQYVVKEK
jgi:hypothetical protein